MFKLDIAISVKRWQMEQKCLGVNQGNMHLLSSQILFFNMIQYLCYTIISLWTGLWRGQRCEDNLAVGSQFETSKCWIGKGWDEATERLIGCQSHLNYRTKQQVEIKFMEFLMLSAIFNNSAVTLLIKVVIILWLAGAQKFLRIIITI